MASYKGVGRILCDAEDTGLLPVDSDDPGMHYIFDRARGEVAILFNRPRRARGLTFEAVRGLPDCEYTRELKEAMEVLC